MFSFSKSLIYSSQSKTSFPHSLFIVWMLDSSIHSMDSSLTGAGAGISSFCAAGISAIGDGAGTSIIYTGTGTANLHLCDLILLNSLAHVGQIVILIYLFIVGLVVVIMVFLNRIIRLFISW